MSTPKLQAFYKSRKWDSFIQTLKSERTNPEGFIICEHCGQPIVKAYDCIGHHIQELTDENVDDAMISLNPDNIKLVHFKCHNQIHKRFGYAERVIQKVFIVYGAPCSGKTTWVNEVAEQSDIILDIDQLWSAIRANACGQYDKPNEIRSNVFKLRDTMIDMIRVRQGKWHNAYIIGGYPLQGERERLADLIGADKIVFIDTPKEICLARAETKTEGWKQYVEDWFDKYRPPTLQ